MEEKVIHKELSYEIVVFYLKFLMNWVMDTKRSITNELLPEILN